MLRFVFACLLIAAPLSLGTGYLAVSNDRDLDEYCRPAQSGEKANWTVHGQPCKVTENTTRLVGVLFAFLTTPAQIMLVTATATFLSGMMFRAGHAPGAPMMPAGNRPFGFVDDRRRRSI